MSIADILGGIGDVKTKQSADRYTDGNYEVSIEKLAWLDKTRKGPPAFIIETKVVSSSPLTEGVTPAPVGTVRGQVIMLSPEYLEMRLGDVRKFLAVLLNIPDHNSYVPDEGSKDEFWINAVTLATSEDQPFKGEVIGLVCETKPTKKGTEFTHHNYFSLAN